MITYEVDAREHDAFGRPQQGGDHIVIWERDPHHRKKHLLTRSQMNNLLEGLIRAKEGMA